MTEEQMDALCGLGEMGIAIAFERIDGPCAQVVSVQRMDSTESVFVRFEDIRWLAKMYRAYSMGVSHDAKLIRELRMALEERRGSRRHGKLEEFSDAWDEACEEAGLETPRLAAEIRTLVYAESRRKHDEKSRASFDAEEAMY